MNLTYRTSRLRFVPIKYLIFAKLHCVTVCVFNVPKGPYVKV
jgi:hypothetical protein